VHTAHKITIECGLLAIPARLGVVIPTSENSMFHQVHTGCGGRIRQKRECELCRTMVEYAEVGKGVEVPGTAELVQITKEELDALQDWEAKTFRLDQFCPAGQVEPLLCGTTYRVSPGHDAKGRAPAMRAAALLAAAMTGEGLVGVGRFGNSLAQLEVRDGEFLVTKLAWPVMLRPADQDTVIDPAMAPRPQELKMAATLLKTMTSDWRPDDHSDTHREAVMALVAAKAAGITVAAPARAGAGPASDMMAVLQQSIDQVKAQRTTKTTSRAPRARKAS
jgi:DNA end-binding protein Ku